MFRMMWRTSTVIRDRLQIYMPSNALISCLRRRDGLGWTVLVSLVIGLTYVLGASFVHVAIERGGPTWLHAFVALWIWNALKFTWLAAVLAWRRRLAKR